MAKEHPIVAALYDRFMHVAEQRGLAQLRAQVVGAASGSVLEIGIGTGLNLPHYQAGLVTKLYALEPDPHMQRRAGARAKSLGLAVDFVKGIAEALPFGDHSIDTVVMTLVFCSVDNVEKAATEVRRVLRPGGALRFLEHVRGSEAWRALLQDLMTPLWKLMAAGCHPNRRTVELLRNVGFEIAEYQQVALGGLPWVNPQVAGVARRR